jgi:hypothetical protein
MIVIVQWRINRNIFWRGGGKRVGVYARIFFSGKGVNLLALEFGI